MRGAHPRNFMMIAASLAMLLPAAYFVCKAPDIQLSSSEKELAFVQIAPLALPSPATHPYFTGLAWPVRVVAREKPALPPPGAPPLPPLPPLAAGPVLAANGVAAARKAPRESRPIDKVPMVSMIYLDAAVKTAIIDGKVVQEGSVAGDLLVVRIEEARVLVRRAGKDTWLRLEE